MTRQQLMRKLNEEGVRVHPSTIQMAMAYGHMSKPTKNDSGHYEYTERHAEQLRKYVRRRRES